MKKKMKRVLFSLLLTASLAICAQASGAEKEYYYVEIPTYSQFDLGYPKGCEGISLYMALQGCGYAMDISVDDFMDTMPRAEDNPEEGYVGNPTAEKNSPENEGKRTTINPAPLAEWGSLYGDVQSLEGASCEELIAELALGNPLVVYITSGFKDAKWGSWDWGEAVTNNHAICLVGYDGVSDEYIVNDCGSNTGVYRVEASVFEKSYNERHFAVVVKKCEEKTNEEE